MNTFVKTVKESLIEFLIGLDSFIDSTSECSEAVSKFFIKGYPVLLSFFVCIGCIFGVLAYTCITAPWVFGLWLFKKVKNYGLESVN